jgi:RimJ/RimL family protein N-acetyltransferase
MAMPLQTARLHLRPLVDADQEFYCRLYTDPAVMVRAGTPLSQEAAQGAFGRVLRQVAAKSPRAYYWMLCECDTQVVIGLMALVFDRDDRNSAEVGVLLLPNAQGQGHAAEAIAVLADRIFAETELTRLWTRHVRGHAAAVGLMCRLGFALGTAEGDHPGTARWQLLRDDWRIAAPPFAKQPPNR